MAKSVGFTSLPREIRDQIYKEVLVSSKPISMHMKFFPRCRFTDKGLELLDPDSSNQQIAQEACEVYYGYNTFESSVEMLQFYLRCGLATTEGQWFFPVEWTRNILVTVYISRTGFKDVVECSKTLFSCPNLRHLTLEFKAMHRLMASWPRGPEVFTLLVGVIYLGRKLRQERGMKPELYLTNAYYLKPLASDPNTNCVGYVDKTENVNWLFDEPDAEVCRKVENNQGSDKEWLMVQMATWVTRTAEMEPNY